MNELVAIAQYAERICAAWRRSAESIIETGRLLIQAKEELGHGNWENMIEGGRVPFKIRMAECLMEIARDERLSKPQTIALLPGDWSTIHAYSKIKDDEKFEEAIHNNESGHEVRQKIKTERRQSRERILGVVQLSLPDKKYGVIVADPEWRFEPWSRESGMDRAADNHYPTSCTEVIAARDVPSIAADDCVLFLWATAPMLPQALLVMEAWGFNYRSGYVWAKDKIGTGYWGRNQHEHLLIGVKGKIPAPAMGTQYPTIIKGFTSRHSAKPECVLDMIEQYFPTLPKIELNRRGPARKNWDSWGNESEQSELSPDLTADQLPLWHHEETHVDSLQNPPI
jgi:N6-adenosine-specific RNA methylase IME4